jgi:hypothetical protein
MEKIVKKTKDLLTIKGELTLTLKNAKTGKIEGIKHYANLVTTVGRKMLADNLTNSSPDNTPKINYVALGTDATAVANGDTTLGTETYRNTTASATNADNIAYITGFFDATEVTGTFEEAGLFADGTGAADSGVLFSHVNISITKSVTQTLTVDWVIQIT